MYLIYQLSDGLVVRISATEIVPDEGYGIASHESFKEGDEFVYTINVLAVDDNGQVVYHQAVQNNPQAARLLAENEQLKQQLRDTEDALIELGNLISGVLNNGNG